MQTARGMNTLFAEANKVILQHDPARKLFVMQWITYHGPHYRKAIGALIEATKQYGATTYISDASRPTDVQSQEDLKFVAEAAQELAKSGVKTFIFVQPKSLIAKMGAKRVMQAANDQGIQRHEVASIEEALALVRARAA